MRGMKGFSILVVLIVILGGCAGKVEHVLKGTYQSEPQDNGYVVQMAFQADDESFKLYIDGREVDSGTYEKIKEGVYKIDGNRKHDELTLDAQGDYDINISNVNQGGPIKMLHINEIPSYNTTEYEDVADYQKLLE